MGNIILDLSDDRDWGRMVRAVELQSGQTRQHRQMRWRRVAGLGVVGLALAIPLAVVGLPLAARALVRGIVLVLNGCVWVAMSISAGMSVWSVLAIVVRAGAGALATPRASAILSVLVVVGALALYGLQRLLGSEEEK